MKPTRLITALLACTCLSSAFAADKKVQPPTPPAPIPPAIAQAKTVFLSNGCEQDYVVCAATYNSLYEGIKTQGKYQLVLAPADADLVFEIRYVSRLGSVSGFNGNTSSYDNTRVHLVILDRPTHYVLWSISEPVSAPNPPTEAILFDLSLITQPGAVAGPAQKVPGFTHQR